LAKHKTDVHFVIAVLLESMHKASLMVVK